jgi:hypothetical protein
VHRENAAAIIQQSPASVCLERQRVNDSLPAGARARPDRAAYSGNGMNSLRSFGGKAIRPTFQSALACSMRSLRDETKFQQMWRRGRPVRQAAAIRDDRTLEKAETLSAVPATVAEHFRFLCEFTKPLVEEAAARDRDFVFLWRVPKLARKDQVVRLNKTRVSNALLAFRNRHDLRNDRGRPLRLGIARMRPTMATELYRRTRDIRKVQQALGHASPLTTAMHYAEKPLEAERDHAFVLDSLVSHLTRMEVDGKVLVAADGGEQQSLRPRPIFRCWTPDRLVPPVHGQGFKKVRGDERLGVRSIRQRR